MSTHLKKNSHRLQLPPELIRPLKLPHTHTTDAQGIRDTVDSFNPEDQETTMFLQDCASAGRPVRCCGRNRTTGSSRHAVGVGSASRYARVSISASSYCLCPSRTRHYSGLLPPWLRGFLPKPRWWRTTLVLAGACCVVGPFPKTCSLCALRSAGQRSGP